MSSLIAFGPFIFIFFLGVVLVLVAQRNRKNRPVEWPDAKIGVAQIDDVRVSGKPGAAGKATVTMHVTVEKVNGSRFKSVLTRKLPSIKHNRLQPGMLIPVMYRPGRTDKVKIARGNHEAHALDFFNRVRIRDGLLDADTLRADQRGRPARSRLESIEPTGKVVRGLREFQLGLTVYPPNEKPFFVTKRLVLMDFEADAAIPGSVLPTRYIPNQPNAVVVSLRPKNAKELAR